MHQVQVDLKNVEDLSDDDLLEVVVSGWEIVCQENESEKHLVTRSQLSAWENFQQAQNEKIHGIILNVDEDGLQSLSADDRRVLVHLAGMIAQATHKTETTIIEEARDKAFREQNATKKQKKASWGKRIKNLFKALSK